MHLLTLSSLALLFHSAKADFDGDITVVNSAASHLEDLVNNWNSNSGLFAALGIQGYFPTLSNAVAALSQDASSLSDADVHPDVINSFVASVSSVLNSLTEKAQDFSNVGAGGIVGNDLQSLASPAAYVVDNIVAAISGDCNKIKSLTSALSEVSAGFSSANEAFNQDQITFSQPASC